MKRFRSVLLLGYALAMIPGLAMGQDRGTITGLVTDAGSRTGLVGAYVLVAGTTLSGVTNQDGRFLILNVPSGQHEVRVSLIGYSAGSSVVTVSAGQTATASFAITPTAVGLEGVVVNAAGQEQRRRETGNSVASITTANVEMAPIQSLANLLQGRAPGVLIQPTSGSTGTGQRIQIRGVSSVSLSSTPLIVVDGIRVNNEVESTGLFTGGTSTSRWNDLNAEDIESVEILKGPAASALYGTAAANGVIQITTKRGRGGQTEIRAYAEGSTLTVPRSLVPDNFRARGFRTDLNRVGDCTFVERGAGTCAKVDSLYQFNPLFPEEFAPCVAALGGSCTYTGANGATQTFVNNSPLREGHQNKVGMSVSGGAGDGSSTYFVGGEVQDGLGTTRGNKLDRVNLRANLTGAVSETFQVNAHTNFVTSYTQLPQEGNTGSGYWLNALFGGDPSPDGIARRQGFRNPYNATNVGWWKNEEQLRRFVGGIGADWRPTSWLRFNGVAGVDQVNRFEQGTIPTPGLATGFFAEGLREQYRTQSRDFTANLNANLTRSLASNIDLNAAIGVQYHEAADDWTYAAGSGLAPGTLTTGEALEVDEFFGKTKLFGLFGSTQFGINDRLFLTPAVRGDQNSAFGENIGFVWYPAMSASWVVKEEPWFPDFDAVSSLRLRAAYGESGQRPGRLSAVRTYETQAVTLGGAIKSGFVVSNAGNPDLRPELSREIEGGLDLGLIEDRVAFELTYYKKKTKDALVARPLPPSVGGPPSQFFNLGEVENHGWEAGLHIDALRMDDVDARLGISYTTNRNKLITIGDSTIPPITVGVQRYVEGYPLGGYWAPSYTWSDANNDGFVQFSEVQDLCDVAGADQTTCQDDVATGTSYQGTPFPTREISITGDIHFLDMFRISGLLDYKGGQTLYNWSQRQRCAESAASSFCEVRHVPGAATLEEQSRIAARQAPNVLSLAGFMESADFWKLRELSLSFTAPTSLMNKLQVGKSLTLTVAGRNLKTWTDYSGWEPESNIPGSVDSDTDPGRVYTVDLFTVPLPRTWILRLDIGL
jgi:TonB-dependent starch-binding outer membrane protein SusC